MYRSIESFSVALVKMIAMEDASCQQKISDTLRSLGRQNPEIVLLTCHDYLSQHTVPTAPEGVVVLEIMARIIKDTLGQISQTLAEKVISLAALWMTRLTGAQTASQEAASNLLVTMSFRFINEIVQLTTTHLEQGQLPHVYMVKTLTKMSRENVYNMVPLLQSILGTMIPVLIGVEEAELKSAFASALGSFSESILIYLGNVEKALDPTVTKESFSSAIDIVYSLFLKVWFEREPSELNIPIVEALGYVSSLLPKDRLEEELPELIPGILSLYKKHRGHLSITGCLCRVLDVATEMRCLGLKTQMDSLLKSLHQQICLSVRFNNPLAVQEHNEILRCFTVLVPAYADSLVKFLLPKLETTDQQVRVGTLSVLRHLISLVSSHFQRKRPQIVAAIKPMLLDQSSNQEKKLIAQVICSMGQQGYLEPEGGKAMVQFLIQQCAASVDSGTLVPLNHQPDQVTDEDLVTVCETVMCLITAAVKMEDVLWPFLLEFVTMTQYTKALTTICNCVAYLGRRKLQAGSERFFLPYNEDADLPKAQALLARLLLVSCCPYRGGSRGAAALRLMQVLSLNIHPATVRGWEEELPSLLDHLLDNSEESLAQWEWEEKLLLLLSRTLNTIDDEEWTGQLGNEIWKQIDTNHHSPQEKGFLYKSLGTVLRQVSSNNIEEQLHQMLLSVQHSECAEREGAAVAIGFCSMTHFDDTLSSLEEFANSNIFTKRKSFLNIPRFKPDKNLDKAKSTLVLCYGNIAFYAPEELVMSRMETHILPAVVRQFTTSGQRIKAESSDLTLKLSLIKSVTLIARFLHSNHHRVSINFVRTRELLRYMRDLMEAESPELLQSPVRQLAMNACKYLVQLHTGPRQADTWELIETCLTSTFSLGPSELDNDKGTNGNTKETATLYTQTMNSLQELLKQILLQDPSPEGLESIFNQVEEWIVSAKAPERERAMSTTLELLKCYWETLRVSNVAPGNKMASLIGRLMPRCADPSLPIGQMALDSLSIILTIQLSSQGDQQLSLISDYLDQQKEQLEVLKAVREQLVNPDRSVLYQTCCQISEVISKCLPHDQLGNLLFAVFRGLADQQPSCSSAAAILMKTIIKRRGSELRDQVEEILDVLRVQLKSVPCEEVKRSVLQSITILASHNTPAVVSCLLTYPVPLDKDVSDMWRSLAEEPECATKVLRELLDILNKQLPFGISRPCPVSENTTGYSTYQTLAAVCGLHELITTPESAKAVTQLFPHLFSALLTHLNSCVNVCLLGPDPKSSEREFTAEPQTPGCRDVCVNCVETLKELLGRTNNEAVAKAMVESGGWDQMMDLSESDKGVVLLARAVVRYAGPSLTGIVDQLAGQILTLQACQTVTVAAFFGEFLKSPLASQLQLTDTLASRLLRCLPHPSPVAQLLCVRGLGNITIGAHHQTERSSLKVIEAMISLMGNQENHEVLTFEVLSTLRKQLAQLRANTIRPNLDKILARIQPLFEAESDQVRAAAFSVLGELAKCGRGGSRSYFCQQVHSNLVGLLVNLDGRSEEVSRSCSSTLRLVLPLIGSAKASLQIEKYLGEPTVSYMDVLRGLSRQLVQDLPNRINSYITDCESFFNNPEEQLRSHAAAFSVLLLHQSEQRFRQARRVTWWNCCCPTTD